MAQLRYIFHPGYDFGRGVPFVDTMHGFVLNKPSQIRTNLLAAGVVTKSDFARPDAMCEDDLSAIHSDTVLRGLRSSRRVADAGEIAALGYLPSSLVRHLFVKPQVRACGGTKTALEHAANGDWVFHLSGGFHHARPELSHGFCLVNDVAWAVHATRQAGTHRRILILDLDLHQGDGNAAFFKDDEEVFTASLHEESAFPIPKVPGDLDVGLRGKIGDDAYLEALSGLLDSIAREFSPEVVVYVAGTDPFVDDAIGSFQVSRAGLRERDLCVARFTSAMGAGLVVLPAGGYSVESPRLSSDGFIAMGRAFQ